MKNIRVNFVDFWPGFKKENNYFYNLLVQEYDVIIDDEPDFLFYSCFGNEYIHYNCTRIFYTPENRRPDYLACDYAFSFDYTSRKNHFRLPYYSTVIDKNNYINKLNSPLSKERATATWKKKTKFCCILVSNPKAKKRLDFFAKLSKIKRVDSAGRILNNIGIEVYDKLEFIQDYKFVIAFENSSYKGYTTEKILDPIYKDCIPIYWGDPLVTNDFNENRFLNYADFLSEEALIERIIEIDQNDALGIEIIQQAPFSVNKIPHELEHKKVLVFLDVIFNSNCKPVAKQHWRYLHRMKFHYSQTQKKVVRKLINILKL
ncbi:glycosyltransferase family 10 domain-containing protein [Flavobacterium degerlachei]|jgi:hypothetical protein|uniref:Glycosyltransferase family 10 (Fucosyltransferase) C-term n=1 Tax=Flavobacterium degerlachei TaxID=229203 RepID=A0A1H2VUA6_9FLAO|nr:glycosyltransferase family 10 [Flavobacterium degerlachei]SDW71982.1 Glycosyltransferase family 10 (fucosyltransferase) C-term [Flavobacterium degerlachei]